MQWRLYVRSFDVLDPFCCIVTRRSEGLESFDLQKVRKEERLI